MNYVIDNEILCATVSDYGAELISVKKYGVEFLWQGCEPFWRSHAPLLFPVCGSLLDQKYTYKGKEYSMPFHGFARHKTFSVVEHSNLRLVLKLCSDDETREIYPFDFELVAVFELLGNEIFVSYKVINKSNEVMPYMLGWHPGLNLPGECAISDFKLKLQNPENAQWYPLQHGGFVRPYGEHYPMCGQDYYLNEEEIYKNDTMIFSDVGNYAYLYCPDNTMILRLRWRDENSYLCVWKNADSKARFICIEPWSDVPADGETPENFDNRKMSRLAPGESKDYQFGIKIG